MNYVTLFGVCLLQKENFTTLSFSGVCGNRRSLPEDESGMSPRGMETNDLPRSLTNISVGISDFTKKLTNVPIKSNISQSVS